MHIRAITYQQQADFFDRATWTGAIREPSHWVMSGTHPSCGAFLTIQDDDPEWMILHTQFPADSLFPAPILPAGGDGACGA